MTYLLCYHRDPIRLIDEPNARYTVSGFVRYAIEPSVEDVSGWLVDKIDYRGQTKIYATFPAQTSTEWIEAGQAITANVSVDMGRHQYGD